MKDQLNFDVTDANTIADSDSVGAYLRSSAGDLITSGDGSSDDVASTFEGLDARSFMFGYDAVGSNWDRIQQVSGAIKVFIDDGDFEVDVVINAEREEDAAHVSGDIGNYVLAVRQDSLASSTSADGDYASFKVDGTGQLYVTDEDGNALLTTIDADTGAIAVSTSSIDSKLTSTNALLTTIDADTSAIALDTAALVIDLAAIEVEQLAQGLTLDSIETDIGSIDSTLTALSKAEDAVHASGDQGIMSLAVRNDAGTALAGTSGDYIPLSTDALGNLRVNISGGTLTVDDVALANTAIATAANPLTAADTAEDAVAAPLASRKYLSVYNNGNRIIFVGASGVSAANGFPVSPGSVLEMRAGAAVDIEWVGPNTSQEIRTLELS